MRRLDQLDDKAALPHDRLPTTFQSKKCSGSRGRTERLSSGAAPAAFYCGQQPSGAGHGRRSHRTLAAPSRRFQVPDRAGRYVEDIAPPGQLHAVVLRSPHAHALIDGIDTAAARAMPGVRGVFTAADLDADGIGTLPCIAQVATVAPMIVPPRPALARDRVRHVGDPVAFVVADTREQARDAAERIAVAYRPLPSVVDAVGGARPRRAAAVGRGAGQSVLPLRARRQGGGRGGVRRGGARRRDRAGQQPARRRADRAARRDRQLRRRRGRVRPAADRPGRAHASATSSPSAVFHMPPERIAVRAPDVGGGFGDQEFPLSRMGAGAVGGAPARPAGPLGRRARRGVRQLRAGPRQPTRARASRSTGTAGFSRSMSIRSPISAPISRPTVPAARRTRRPARWAGSTTSRPCS